MATRDTVPGLQPHQPFPVGDIEDAQKEQQANAWLSEIETLDDEAYRQRIGRSFMFVALPGLSGIYQTHSAAKDLCLEWDRVKDLHDGRGRQLAYTGYSVASAFVRATAYLPRYNVNFTPELNLMKQERGHLAAHFAHTTWNSMSLYPKVNDKFDRLFEHTRSRTALYSDDDRDYYHAGMGLVFMISLMSSLVDQTPQFKGMAQISGQKPDLKNNAHFRKLFTDDL